VRLDGPVARATRFQWPLDGGSAADLQTLTAQLRDLLVSEGGPLDAAGVATPCTLDPSGVVIAWPSRPSWVGVDLRGALEPLLGPRLRFGDDGDLAAAAEAAEAGAAVLVYLGVGTGIGGGVVLGGRRHPGSLGAAGEIGHVMVRRGGPRCRCGRRGCLQATASGPATLARAAALRGAPVPPEAFAPALEQGAPWALAALRRTAAALASAVVTVDELLQPDLIRIGGGFATGVPQMVPLVREAAAGLARPGRPVPTLQPAVFGAMSSLEGAVQLARAADREPEVVA